MSAQNVKNVRIKKALICKVESFRFKIFLLASVQTLVHQLT